MAPAPTSSDSSAEVKASYSSSSGKQAFSHSLTTKASLDKIYETDEPASFSKAKTNYLSELRTSVKQMQSEINVFLTAKMEQDKKALATNGQTNGKGKDEIEEEKYGEEDVEED